MTETQDVTLVLAKLAGVIGTVPDVSRVLAFTHLGVPQPKARARYSLRNKRFYTPSSTQDAETALTWEFKSALGRRPSFIDTVALVAIFFVPTRVRKDVDNYVKLVMDGATKAKVWKDDSQVVIQGAYIVLDPMQPRTVVAIAPCESSLSAAPLLTATGAI